MAYAAARRKRDGQYGREKFYSLVIHGCPRITGSLLRTGPTKFGRENALYVTRREKILVIGAVSFQSFGRFSYRVISRSLSLRSCPQTSFLPFHYSFCPRCPPLFPISPPSRFHVAYTTNFCLRKQRPNRLGINSKVSGCVMAYTNDSFIAISLFSTNCISKRGERIKYTCQKY